MATDPKPLDLVASAIAVGLQLAEAEMVRHHKSGDADAFTEAESKATALRVAMALCGREAALPDTASLAAALTSAIAIADEAVTEWDRAPSGARPGKILMALSGRLPGYRKDADLVHAALYQATARNAAGVKKATPRVTDDDKDAITVSLDGRELRGWSYADDDARRQKMLQAREYVEGWCDGREARLT
jgi:hypothetical protein